MCHFVSSGVSSDVSSGVSSNAGCDLPGVGGWEGSTYSFVLLNPVLEQYE